MPDIVVHNAMGDRVLQRLDHSIAADIDRDIFRVAVMGPDPFMYYRFFAPHFRHGIHRRSSTMHMKKPQQFLMELAKRSSSREMFSYFAGFLCHYALDSTVHPFINKMSGHRGYMHIAIERRMDAAELKRQGKQRKEIMQLFTKSPDLTEAQKAMQAVYGWDDDFYSIGYRYMKLYHLIAKDQHGVLRWLLRPFKKLSAVPFDTKRADHLDLRPLDALVEDAVEMGTQLVSAAYRFREGGISAEELQELIGRRNYAGGEAAG